MKLDRKKIGNLAIETRWFRCSRLKFPLITRNELICVSALLDYAALRRSRAKFNRDRRRENSFPLLFRKFRDRTKFDENSPFVSLFTDNYGSA